jgi:hypothetical protein
MAMTTGFSPREPSSLPQTKTTTSLKDIDLQTPTWPSKGRSSTLSQAAVSGNANREGHDFESCRQRRIKEARIQPLRITSYALNVLVGRFEITTLAKNARMGRLASK